MATRGRPPKYGPELHAAICRDLAAGMSRTTAAERNGIDRGTLEDWRERYPAFNPEVRASIAKAKARASVAITTAIQQGDVAASFRYLALHEREEWGTGEFNLNVHHSGSITVKEAEKEAARLTALGIPTAPEDLLLSEEVTG